MRDVLDGIKYAAAGLTVFFAVFVLLIRVWPFHVWEEIIEKRNMALAVLLGAISIAVGMIVSSAVH